MRRTALVAFALLMLVSGCVSPPPASAPPPLQPAPPPDLPPIDSQPAFGEAIFVTTLSRNVDPARLGRSPIPAEEPLLAADARGTIYVALPITRALFHSDDGQSFVSLWDSRESREEGLAGINDASLLADDDVLYWAGLDFRGGVAEQGFVPFQRSEDRGATWSPPVLALDPGTRLHRPWIARNPQTAELLVAATDFRDLLLTSSADDGATWSPVATIPGGILLGPAVAAETSFVVPYLEARTGAVHVAIRESAGVWTTRAATPALRSDGAGTHLPILARDSGGTLYLVYVSGDEASSEVQRVRMVVSRDGGESWDSPIAVSAPGRSAGHPWVLAGSAGRVAVAFYQSDAGSRQIPAQWTVFIAATDRGDREDVRWLVGPVSRDPAHFGTNCQGCVLRDASRLDHLGFGLLPSGHPIVAWGRDAASDPGGQDIVVARALDLRLR